MAITGTFSGTRTPDQGNTDRLQFKNASYKHSASLTANTARTILTTGLGSTANRSKFTDAGLNPGDVVSVQVSGSTGGVLATVVGVVVVVNGDVLGISSFTVTNAAA